MRRRSFLKAAASMVLIPEGRSALAPQTLSTGDGEAVLTAMLRLLPDEPIDELGVRYANYEAQRAALSIEETGVDIAPDR